MSGKLTTHVLDLGQGGPAIGMRVELYAGDPHTLLAAGRTNADGRLDEPLLSGETMRTGMYELTFHAGDYLADQAAQTPLTLWDRIPIRFAITDEQANYHIPLLLSPGGYSTYRGS